MLLSGRKIKNSFNTIESLFKFGSLQNMYRQGSFNYVAWFIPRNISLWFDADAIKLHVKPCINVEQDWQVIFVRPHILSESQNLKGFSRYIGLKYRIMMRFSYATRRVTHVALLSEEFSVRGMLFFLLVVA